MNIPRLPYSKDRLFGFLFLIALLIPLAFSLFNFESFEIIKYGLLMMLVGAALFVSFRSSELFTRPLRGNKLFFITLGLFWLWVLVVSIFAWDRNYSFFGFYARFTNGFTFYSLWSVLILLLGLLSFEQIKILLKVLVFCSGLIAVWGLLQSVGLGFYMGPTSDFFNRGAVSFLGNPNFASMFVAALVPLSALFYSQAIKFKAKLYYAVSIFFQLWSLAIFASRGALLALFLGLAMIILLAAVFLKKRGLKFLVVLLVVFALGLGFSKEFLDFSRPNTVQTTVSFNDPNIQNRLGVWKLSVSSMLKRPILGVGLGNFQMMFEHDRKNIIVNVGFFDDAHNLPLELGVTGGFPLVLLFFALIIFAMLSALKKVILQADAEAAALIACVVAWLVASMFTPVPIACYVILAVLLSSCFKENFGLLPKILFNRQLIRRSVLCLALVVIVYGAFFEIAENLFYAGTIAYSSNRFSEAYKYTTAAIWFNPVNRLYYVYQAGSAIRSGLPISKINSILATANKLNPKRAHSYVQDASLNYLLFYQTKDQAYQDIIINKLDRAIELDPFFADNYYLLAQYQLIFGRQNEGVASLRKGLSINPQNLEAWALLAKVYQFQNNRQELLQTLNEALKTQPDNISVIKLIRLVKNDGDMKTLPFTVHFGIGQLD